MGGGGSGSSGLGSGSTDRAIISGVLIVLTGSGKLIASGTIESMSMVGVGGGSEKLGIGGNMLGGGIEKGRGIFGGGELNMDGSFGLAKGGGLLGDLLRSI